MPAPKQKFSTLQLLGLAPSGLDHGMAQKPRLDGAGARAGGGVHFSGAYRGLMNSTSYTVGVWAKTSLKDTERAWPPLDLCGCSSLRTTPRNWLRPHRAQEFATPNLWPKTSIVHTTNTMERACHFTGKNIKKLQNEDLYLSSPGQGQHGPEQFSRVSHGADCPVNGPWGIRSVLAILSWHTCEKRHISISYRNTPMRSVRHHVLLSLQRHTIKSAAP